MTTPYMVRIKRTHEMWIEAIENKIFMFLIQIWLLRPNKIRVFLIQASQNLVGQSLFVIFLKILVRKDVLIICYFSKTAYPFLCKFIFWKLCWHILKRGRPLSFLLFPHCSTLTLTLRAMCLYMITKHFLAFICITTVSNMVIEQIRKQKCFKILKN